MSNIVKTFKEINKHLDDNEKATLEKLTAAHDRAQEGLDKESVIKEQSSALVRVLDPSAVGTDQEKMWAACLYFSGFAEDMEEKVKEAEDALREAGNILQGAKNELLRLWIKRVQDIFNIRTDSWTDWPHNRIQRCSRRNGGSHHSRHREVL